MEKRIEVTCGDATLFSSSRLASGIAAAAPGANPVPPKRRAHTSLAYAGKAKDGRRACTDELPPSAARRAHTRTSEPR